MPISASRRAPNWPWSKTKTLPKIAELNVGISTKPTLTSLRPSRPTTTTVDRSDGTTRHWQWSLPNGITELPTISYVLLKITPKLCVIKTRQISFPNFLSSDQKTFEMIDRPRHTLIDSTYFKTITGQTKWGG